MPNPFVSGRLPQNLFEDLEAYCANSGKTRTQVLICALESYLGVSLPASTDLPISVDRVLGLEEYVKQLVKQQVSLELQRITDRFPNNPKKP